MGVSVILKDQGGAVLASLGRGYVPLVGWDERSNFPILGHVDLYGNTAYNRGQMETLLLELERIRSTASDLGPDKESMIQGLESICNEGVKKPHRFLWFIGD